MKILESRSIYYKDVNIIAQYNDKLSSRKEIPLELHRIIASPMPAIVGDAFVKASASLGITVCMHRFQPIENQIKQYRLFIENGGNPRNIWWSIGLNDTKSIKMIDEEFKKYGSYTSSSINILIDVANGYLDSILQFLESLEVKSKNYNLMVGNIHSSSIMNKYTPFINNNQRMLFRVGIANGSACATKDMTGVNRGQITEISECHEWCKYYKNVEIIADGGIRDPECASKAFGAGATNVMIGGYFALSEEAQNVVENDFTFFGCASAKNLERMGKAGTRHSEGKEFKIDTAKIKPLKELVDDMWGGISSCISYSGYNTLTNFIGNATFEVKIN